MENSRRTYRTHRRTSERSKAEGRTTRRSRRKRNVTDEGFKEKIIMQCIISGAIFLSILVINLIDTDFTNNIKYTIKSALTSNSDIDSVKSTADNATNYFSLIQETVKTIFGHEESSEETSTEMVEDDSDDFRIDEDILELMNESSKKQ